LLESLRRSGLSVKTLTSGWTVIKEVPISPPPSMVFKALTSPDQLNEWFTNRAKVDLRVGGRYSNNDGDRGRFLEIVPNKRLRFSWDNPSWAPGSIVEILLKRIKNRTVLTLIHSGFEREKERKHYASVQSGWDWALANLKSYVEGRKTIGYEDWLRRVRT
jgi:uncharacterized protein YndB with AHSA1/START domain